MLGNDTGSQSDMTHTQMTVCVFVHERVGLTYGRPLRVSNVEDLFLLRHLEDVVHDGRKVLQSHFIVTAGELMMSDSDITVNQTNDGMVMS